jgi:hypothetical protein
VLIVLSGNVGLRVVVVPAGGRSQASGVQAQPGAENRRARSAATAAMPGYPPVDESHDRLYHAGWSLGETCFGQRWQVDGSNGENRLFAIAASQAETWYRATVQARELGMLVPVVRGCSNTGKLR